MENSKSNVSNLVKAKGRIIGIGKDDFGHPRLILYIRSNSTRPASYFSVAIGEAGADQDLRMGDFVEVEGHMIGYSVKSRVWDRTTHVQYIVADKITLCDTLLKKAFDIEEGFSYGYQYINVCLRGEVEDIEFREDSGWTVLALGIKEDGRRPCTVKAQYSKKMRVNDVKYEKGDTVCLVGTMVSKRKEKDGKIRFYENIVIDDMAVLKRVADEEEEDDALSLGLGE